MKTFLVIFLPLISLPLTIAIADDQLFVFEKDDVVAFLGGTNIVNLQRDGTFEARIQSTGANQKIRFRDFAWEGDTVFQQGTVIERWREGKFGDLARQLSDNNISVVMAQFGQSEALAGVAEPDKFKAAYDQLLTTLQSNGRRVVLVSPIRFESTAPPLPDLSQRNNELKKYVDSIKQLADQHECHFVNLFTAPGQSIDRHRLTKNGLHVLPARQKAVADTIGDHLGLPTIHDSPTSHQLRHAVTAKHQLWMNYWRPANWKCLYGDDGNREFGKSTDGGLTLREEWNRLPQMIQEAENAIAELATQVKEGGTK